MKAVLIAGASVVLGQTSEQTYCAQQNNLDMTTFSMSAKDTCTTSNVSAGCTLFPGYCSRTSATPCATTSMTCDAASDCKAGSYVTNAKTCSTCAQSCSDNDSNATCSAKANCKWTSPICVGPATMPPSQCGAGQASSSACTALENCYWASITTNICGKASTSSLCQPCNLTTSMSTEDKSVLFKSIGNKCTWKASGDFTQPFSVQVNALAQNAKCTALTTTGMMDNAALTKQYQAYFAADTAAVCAPAANSASALAPALAAMALLVFTA